MLKFEIFLRSDHFSEVRRAALVNIPLVPASLDTILGRTRDVDPVTRKLVYLGVLQSKLGHPRQLSIAQRELIVKDGLGDREPGVRVAAGKLVASWFDMAMAEAPKTKSTWNGDDGGVMKGLIHFLGLFDMAGLGEPIAVDAVLSILTIRPDIPDVFTFEGSSVPFVYCSSKFLGHYRRFLEGINTGICRSCTCVCRALRKH
jgi:condensin complex subunit 3